MISAQKDPLNESHTLRRYIHFMCIYAYALTFSHHLHTKSYLGEHILRNLILNLFFFFNIFQLDQAFRRKRRNDSFILRTWSLKKQNCFWYVFIIDAMKS